MITVMESELIRLLYRAIGCSPFEAAKLRNKAKVNSHLMKYRSKQRIKRLPVTLDVGDIVRISVKKGPFHRGYNNQRTQARYVIR